ncbi:rCG24973 [Rattus norvegicus]|uniref:RCG24973 n=1 Tax=Rattus norvegicus TaxID=10116 RepID=A6KFG9_RAT|nr:rCG24973 [Rattus norvegicus]
MLISRQNDVTPKGFAKESTSSSKTERTTVQLDHFFRLSPLPKTGNMWACFCQRMLYPQGSRDFIHRRNQLVCLLSSSSQALTKIIRMLRTLLIKTFSLGGQDKR